MSARYGSDRERYSCVSSVAATPDSSFWMRSMKAGGAQCLENATRRVRILEGVA
jgi:hypothetical protein